MEPFYVLFCFVFLGKSPSTSVVVTREAPEMFENEETQFSFCMGLDNDLIIIFL